MCAGGGHRSGFCRSESRQAFANPGGEIGAIAGGFGAIIDQAALFQIGERDRTVERTGLVGQFVHVAVQQNPPVPANFMGVGIGMLPDAGGAIVGQGIVPFRVQLEVVDRAEVIEQDASRQRQVGVEAIEIDLLAAVVRAQPDQVAFVRDDVSDFLLAEETLDR